MENTDFEILKLKTSAVINKFSFYPYLTLGLIIVLYNLIHFMPSLNIDSKTLSFMFLFNWLLTTAYLFFIFKKNLRILFETDSYPIADMILKINLLKMGILSLMVFLVIYFSFHYIIQVIAFLIVLAYLSKIAWSK